MNLILKTLLIIIFFILPNLAFSNEIKCKIDKPMGQTIKKYLNKWISPINIHFIDNDKIIFKNKIKSAFLDKDKYIGKILKNTSKKLVWQYSFTNKNIKAPSWSTAVGKNREKNSIFRLTFELRKSNNRIFFEGGMDKTFKNQLWVEGIGECKITEKPKISEEELKLKAEKLAKEEEAKEKAKQQSELKAQILAEENAKQESELKAQILAEEKEKLKEELRKTIRAELKEKQLIKEKVKLQAKEKAQKLANEKIRLAKEKVKKKAQKLAREQARIKAEKIAKEKAKKVAVQKALNKKDFLEYANLVNDIQLFLSKGSSFDPVKIAKLFVKFNGLAQGKWTSNTFKAYRDLKNYALSFEEFRDFMVEQEVNRENFKQEKINKLSDSLIEKSKTLKEFITKNLTSKKTPRALELISKIEKILLSENLNRLDNLNQEVDDWISKKLSINKSKKANSGKKIIDKYSSNVGNEKAIKNKSKDVSSGGIDFTLSQMNKFGTLCEIFFDIKNNTGLNITGGRATSVFKEEDGSIISKDDILIPRVKKDETELVSLFIKVKACTLVKFIKIKVVGIEVDGDSIEGSIFDKASDGQKNSKISRVLVE